MRSFSETEWSDLINFEGNANAFSSALPMVTKGKTAYGMQLTYTTLALDTKVPLWVSGGGQNTPIEKYGFFAADRQRFEEVVTNTCMRGNNSTELLAYKEAPLCLSGRSLLTTSGYRIIDMEDAQP